MSGAVTEAAKATLKSVPLRLIALPLSRNPELIYYYANLEKKKGRKAKQDKGKEKEDASSSSTLVSEVGQAEGEVKQAVAQATAQAQQQDLPLAQRIPQYISKATNYASDKWEQFGKADKGNWRYKTYMAGERLMDRIEYEEWLLKALDASTAPKLWSRSTKPKVAEDGQPADGQVTKTERINVPLYFPKSMLSADKVLSDIKKLLDHREPHHQSLLRKSMILIPFTFPFALIPVIPNFPLFYVLWRTWSHWRALKSSQYLKALIAHDQLRPEPSPILDELYKKAGERGQANLTDPESPPANVLLTKDMVDELSQQFSLENQAGVDLRRAISQAEARLKK